MALSIGIGLPLEFQDVTEEILNPIPSGAVGEPPDFIGEDGPIGEQ